MLLINLNIIRNKNGLGIRELSRKSGVSQPIISNIESGKSKNPTIITLLKIAKALEVTIDELVDTNNSEGSIKIE